MKLTDLQKARTDIKFNMKIFKVFPDKGLTPYYEDKIENIILWLEELMPGDSIRIDILEMTKEEYDALPEYMGS